MKKTVRIALQPVFLGSLLALSQPAFSVGEPEFPARPLVSDVAADHPDVPATVHCGKTLVIPLVANGPEGGPLTYTVTTSQPWLLARVRTGHPVMKMRVRSTNDGSGVPIDGTMEFALFRADAPDTAEFIAGFAQAPYYENVLFHRVIKDFVLQGGDPAGTGSGAAPYTLPHEFNSHLIYTGRGQLAMANSSGGYNQTFPSYGRTFQSTNAFGFPDGTTEYITAKTEPTNGSQFFITLGQPRHLDFKHSLFGQLLRGFDVMDKVANVPVNGSDKPTANVTMSELSVNPSVSDGVLLVSATSVGTGTVTVTATDVEGKTAQKIYNLTADEDTVNDPPILAPLEPQVVPLGVAPTVKTVAEDLEHDAITTRMPLRIRRTFFNGSPATTDTIYASFSRTNLGIVARPTIGAWDVTVGVSGFNDPQLNSSPFDASRFQLLEIGVGDKAISATPVTLEAKANVASGSVTVASFRYGGTNALPADFAVTVNWGDGSALQASTTTTPAVSIVPSVSKPGTWDVKGSHTYVRAGVYPLHVTIDGSLGATRVARGSAVVAAEGALFSALGQRHEVSGPVFAATKPIAIISDVTGGISPSDFSTVIDWGDGNRTTTGAAIRQIGFGRFGVFASHRYADAETYSVMVKVTRDAFSASAWSALETKGFKSPRYLPPFDKANLTLQWTPSVQIAGNQASGLPQKTTVGSQTSITGFFFLLNGGSKPAISPKLRFYLSNDRSLVASGVGADTLLRIGPPTSGMTQIPLNTLAPGEGGTVQLRSANGLNLSIQLPSGETGAGKYLIADVDYHDPITDHMLVPKSVVFGPLPGIIVKLPGTQTSLLVREGAAGAFGTTTTFTVALDTLPTANVTIPLEVLNTSSTLDESQVSFSPSSLVFTPQNGKVPQTVTITSKNDLIRESDVVNVVRLKPATSADVRFSSMDGADVPVTISDDDPTGPRGILVSRSSISIAEGGSVTFTVRPSSAPTQNTTMALEIVDENGAVIVGQATLSSSSITFTAANGTNQQNVTVTATNDTIPESTRNLTIRLKPLVSTDTNFSGVDPADIPLTILDND